MSGSAPPTPSLLSPIFESAAICEIFSDRATIRAMLDFEAALAAAEAEAGIVPPEAAAAIEAACRADSYDLAEFAEGAVLSGNLAIPLVKALTERVGGEARGYVHWGATSQDVIDTALMLCARGGLARMAAGLRDAIAATAALVENHRFTLMPGRTLLQQALPIAFGCKAAVWLAGLCRARRAIRRAASECVALQFGGAAGTLAALGGNGANVRARLARILDLPDAPVPWHAERSRVFGIAAALAEASGIAAKIAVDVALLMQSEVGEAFEPSADGKGGSSTMPQKRNPVAAVAIRANHRRVAGLMATMTLVLEGEHERAAGAWHAEWQTVRDLFCLTGGSVGHLAGMLAGLEVDAARMRKNLDAALGLPQAESLMMALAAKIGRGDAKRVVEGVTRRALAERRPLGELAADDAAIAAALTRREIASALEPENYLGDAGEMMDAALAAARRELESD